MPIVSLNLTTLNKYFMKNQNYTTYFAVFYHHLCSVFSFYIFIQHFTAQFYVPSTLNYRQNFALQLMLGLLITLAVHGDYLPSTH